MKKPNIFTILNYVALVILVLFIGAYIGQYASVQNFFAQVGLGSGSQAALYENVLQLIQNDYFKKNVSTADLKYASIKGMVNSLNDPATLFLTPSDEAQFQNVESGTTFAGIGVELGYQNNKVIVRKILANGPASKTQMHAGDEIIAVNGTDVSKDDITTITNMIRGVADSRITLTMQSLQTNTQYSVSMTRATIQVPSMDVATQTDAKGNPIDVLTISRFTDTDLQTWESNWDSAMTQIQKDNPKGVIIDVRDNPGGFFDAAIYALSDFLPKNSVGAIEEDRNNGKLRFYTQSDPRFGSLPIKVLVNSQTASAAEIFSGAMQYYKRAQLIGTNTYGKGTEQQVFNFSDGSSLHLTVLHWLLPSGKWIQKTDPLKPDVAVDYSNQDFLAGTDPQLTAALQSL